MKLKLNSLVLPFLFSSFALAAEPENTNNKNSPHFGIVDMQRVILSVNEGKDARASLEKEIKAKEIEFQKKKEELDQLSKEWKEQAQMLSEKARMQKQQDFQEKLIEQRNAEMNSQNQIKQKEGQATQKIAMNVTKIVDGMARSQNLDGVFEINSSGLLYLRDPVDLTEQVIKKYNESPKSDSKKSTNISESTKTKTDSTKL